MMLLGITIWGFPMVYFDITLARDSSQNLKHLHPASPIVLQFVGVVHDLCDV